MSAVPINNIAKLFGKADAAPAPVDPAPTQEPQPAPETISREEAKAAFAQRDVARNELKQIIKAIGLDPATVKFVKTEDPANPLRLESPELNAAIEAMKQHRERAKQIAAKQHQVETAFETELATAASANNERITAYQKHVNHQAVELELKKALVGNALDTTGDGSYSDLVALLKGRLKATTHVDESTGKLRVSVAAVDADGNPLTASDGKPIGVKSVVDDFLATRPALRARGPNGQPVAKKPEPKPGNGAVASDLIFGKPLVGVSPIPGPKKGAAQVPMQPYYRGSNIVGVPEKRAPADGEKGADVLFGKRRF